MWSCCSAHCSAHISIALNPLEDGAEALAFLKRQEAQTDERAPDLTVPDLNLPKNDGVEVLQAMRASRAFAEAPVTILIQRGITHIRSFRASRRSW
jgi:DNA-binding response OmpR family regulator